MSGLHCGLRAGALNDSFPVFRLLGIQVRLHVLFVYMVVLLLFMGAMNGSPWSTVTLFLLLFGLVLLHELGHCLMARRFGIGVIDIVLWPLGGMARMADIPEDPKVEGWVAAAGPLVNLGLALPAAALHLAAFGPDALARNPFVAIGSVEQLSALFVWINGMLGVFNLVPAFPMDGGRLLRAWLARRRTWLEATEQAVRVGRVVAWAMILSILAPRNLGLSVPIIGGFVLIAGSRELWATRLRHAAGGSPVNLAELFFRGGRTPDGEGPPGGPTGSPPQRPTHGSRPEPPGGEGFTDEDVERMERYRGRLRP